MTLLNDLKNFLISKNNNLQNKIAFNFDDYNFNDDKLVLLAKGGEFGTVSQKTIISVIVKNIDMQVAETLINSAFNSLFPDNQYLKPMDLNGKITLLIPLQPPFYKEKQQDGKHVFSFDFKIVQKK